jgi:hypothetical protein
MDLSPFVDGIRRDLTAAADLAGPGGPVAADRLLAAIESAVRLALLAALSAAAEEITRELAPGAVEVRLRGRDPDFVVTVPVAADIPVTEPFHDEEDTGTARITLRLPESLKGRIEADAARERVSVNAWLVRALSSAVGGGGDRSGRRRFGPGSSLQGWVR